MLLRIGVCEIDFDRRRITRGGAEQPLAPKAFDLLLALVVERPKVVSKDTLIKKVWTDTFVADANLAILIGDIRVALGDSAQQPSYIKTHHRVGYSFIGEVSEIAASPRSDTPPCFILAVGVRRIALYQGTVTVGRDETCDIFIDHPSVSRLHAYLVVDIDTIAVEDNGSKNGTRIDHKRLTERRAVTPGQRLSFGSIDTSILRWDAGSTITTPDSSN